MRIHTKVVYQFDPDTGEMVEVEDHYYEYLGPVSQAKGGGGGTTTTTAQPPDFQIPYINKVLGEATSLYGQGPLQYYPGQTVAPQSPETQQAITGLAQNVAPAQQAIADQTQQGLTYGIQAANPLQNPFFEPTLQAMIRPATEQLTQQVLPGIQDTFASAGQFGGSRQGVAEGNAINAWQQNVLDTASKFGSQAYGQGLESLGRSLALAPNVQQMQATPTQTLASAGAANDAYQQRLIDEMVARYNYNQQAPYESLSYYAGLVGNPLGSATSQTAPGGSSRLQSALGGAATGAALGASIPGLGAGATLLGPAGWAGLAIGGALGLFG